MISEPGNAHDESSIWKRWDSEHRMKQGAVGKAGFTLDEEQDGDWGQGRWEAREWGNHPDKGDENQPSVEVVGRKEKTKDISQRKREKRWLTASCGSIPTYAPRETWCNCYKMKARHYAAKALRIIVLGGWSGRTAEIRWLSTLTL